MTHQQIVSALRSRRKALGITLSELSEQTEIRATTICDIENGKRNPSITTLLRLTDALGLSIIIQ